VAEETIALHNRDGRVVDARGAVRRVSHPQRVVRAGAVAGTSFVLAAVSIFIPGVHLIAPWLLPIIGVFVAVFVYQIGARVDDIHGECPGCDASLNLPLGGTIDNEPLWLRCPGCNAPFEVRIRSEA
jgi:hypothetical protein